MRDGGASLRRCSATQSDARTASGPSAAASAWASAGIKTKQQQKNITDMLIALGLAWQDATV